MGRTIAEVWSRRLIMSSLCLLINQSKGDIGSASLAHGGLPQIPTFLPGSLTAFHSPTSLPRKQSFTSYHLPINILTDPHLVPRQPLISHSADSAPPRISSKCLAKPSSQISHPRATQAQTPVPPLSHSKTQTSRTLRGRSDIFAATAMPKSR